MNFKTFEVFFCWGSRTEQATCSRDARILAQAYCIRHSLDSKVVKVKELE
jgi:hypothetical protein